jgi:YgiT-type zinc finger domain-containing protein
MKCHVCGSELRSAVTGLPFKRTDKAIVIIKGLPVLECGYCTECLLEDPAMAAVEAILDRADEAAELEMVKYPA